MKLWNILTEQGSRYLMAGHTSEEVIKEVEAHEKVTHIEELWSTDNGYRISYDSCNGSYTVEE